jgi:hypothetical protein
MEQIGGRNGSTGATCRGLTNEILGALLETKAVS